MQILFLRQKLTDCTAQRRQGAVFKRSAGGRVVDDSYNANPAAVRPPWTCSRVSPFFAC